MNKKTKKWEILEIKKILKINNTLGLLYEKYWTFPEVFFKKQYKPYEVTSILYKYGDYVLPGDHRKQLQNMKNVEEVKNYYNEKCQEFIEKQPNWKGDIKKLLIEMPFWQ